MTSNNSNIWGRKGNGAGETGDEEQKAGVSLARDNVGQRREPHISGKEWVTPNTTSRTFYPPKSSSSSSSPRAAVDVPPGFGGDRGSGYPLKVVEGERVRDFHRVINEDNRDPVSLPAVEPETLLERERSLGAGSMTWAPSQRIENENKSSFPGKVDNAPRRGFGFGQLDSTGREVVHNEREFDRRVDRYSGSREDLQRKSSATAQLNSGRDLSSIANEMEGRIDRYASNREDSHRRSGTFPQLDTGRESTSAEKEMEGRVDRYASSRDSHSRESDHGIKTLPSSNFDWRKRDRSALAHASSRSPPLIPANTSSQDMIVRRQGAAFDISAGTPSPQVSPFSGSSSLALEGGQDDASHLSPPKRPRLGWGQGLAKYEKKKVGDGDEASKSLSVTRGEVPPTAEPQSEEESPLDGAPISGSWGTPSSSVKALLSEIAIGDNSATVTEGIGPKLEPGSGHDIRLGNSVEGGGTTLPELTGTHLDSSSVKPTIQSGVSGAPQLSPSGLPDQVEAPHPSRYLRLTREADEVCGGPTKISNDDEYSKPGEVVDDLSTWTKEAILMRVEKVEGEIDSLEKELAKVARYTDSHLPKKVGCSFLYEGGHSQDVAQNVALDQNGRDYHTSASSLPSLPSPSMVDAVMVEYTYEKIVEQVTTLSPCAKSSLSSATEQVNNLDVPPLKSSSACLGETDHDGEEDILKDITNDIPAEAKRQLTVKDMQVKQITDVVFASDYESRSRMAYQWSLVYSLIQENRKLAKEAAAPFSNLLSKDASYDRLKFYGSPEDAPAWRENVESHLKNQERMQTRLAEWRKLLRFKERVLALKYRALKEECQNGQIMLCQRRDRVKAVRRWEVDRRNASGFALANQRPTLRLRPVLATSARTDATQEEHLKKRILAVIPANHLRQDLKMPSMIIDEKERSFRRFVNQNGLVEDPVSYEQERKSMNPWTAEEKKLFLEKFAVFNKNFNKIASFLEHKTTADCVEYYYRNQKSEEFERIRRRQQLKKRRDYSVAGASYLATTTPGNNRHHRDVNATRVQALTLAAYAASRDCSKALRGSSHKSVDKGRPDSGILENMVVKPGFVKESRAGSIPDPTLSGISPDIVNAGTPFASKNFREKLAGKTGSGFVSPSAKVIVLEQLSGSRGMRTTLIHHDPAKIDGEEVDSEWTDTERQCFIDAVIRFGKEFKSIAGHVGSKTQTQCKTYFSKIRKRFKLDELVEQSQESPHLDSGLGGVVMKTESTCDENVENPGEVPTVEIIGGEGQESKVTVDEFKFDMAETFVADGLMLLGQALEPEIAALASKLPDVSTMASPVSTAASLGPPKVSLVPSTVSHSSWMTISTVSPVPSAVSIVPSAVSDLSKVSDLLPLTSDFQAEGTLPSEVSDLPEKVLEAPSLVRASPAEVLHLPSKPSIVLSRVSDLLSVVADLPSNGSDFVPKDSDLPLTVSDLSSTKPGNTPILVIATEEREAGDAEIVPKQSTGSVLLNELKHPEQTVKAEQVDNDSHVNSDGLVKIQNGTAELSGMKPEPETLGKITTEIGRESDNDDGQPVRSLERSSGVSDVAHPEDNFSSVVVKAEPMVPLDAGGASLTGILPPTAHAVSLSVAAPPSIHSGQPRERGNRIAGAEFKPRREPTSWTQEEKEKFAEIIRRHGKDWSLLHENLPAKSLTQIKTYFQNSKAKLGFLPTDGLANITARGGSNRKRKAEESDTSSNAGSTGQTPNAKVSLSSDDISQKVISSSMMSMSSNIGTPIVGGDGPGYPHFNPPLVQSGEDSSSVRDIQRLMRRMVAATEYPSQSTIPSALMPLFQPGSFPTTSAQQPLLLGPQKQQVMVGHQPPQHPLPATQAILQQQQQISQMTPTQRQLLTLKVVQQLHQQQLQQQQPQQQQQLPQTAVSQQLQHQLHQQVTQMVAATKQQQQQQQHHLAQVVKHIQPQLLQHVQQAIPLATPAHPHQLGSRLKQAVSQQQPQVAHGSRVPHPSSQQLTFLQQQQFFQQQKQHLIQQLQQEHMSQQIQYQLQLTQKQIQQQPQLQQLQQLHQLHQFQLQKEHAQQQIQQQIHQQQVQQQQVQKQQVQQQQQLQQSLGLFRTPYQSFFVDPDLLRQSETMEHRSTASKLGLLPREDLQQPQTQRPAQVFPQQPVRTTSSAEPQQLRLGDVKLFGQSLLSQPPINAGQASMSSSQKQWEPKPVTAAPTGPVNMLTSNISKVYGKDPSLLPSAFTRAGGSIRLGEGHAQAWSAASSGNLDTWNSMVGGLQGVVVYKNDDAKSDISSAQDAVARVTARLSREAHDKDGEDMYGLEHVDSGGTQDLQSKEAVGDIVRGKDVVEVPSELGLERARMEGEWRNDSLQPMSSDQRGAQGGVSTSEQGGFTEEILQQLVKGMAGSGPLGPHASALAQIFREAQSKSVQENLLSSMSKSSRVSNLGPRISESQVVSAGPSFQSSTALRSHPGQEEESVPSDSKNPQASSGGNG